MSQATRVNLAQAMGGTEHYSQVLTLLEQYDLILKATKTSMNSQNSAYIENQKYLQSTEGKLNKLKVAYEKLSTHTINSDFTKGLIDSATSVVNAIDSLVQRFGVLNVIVPTVVASILLFNKNLRGSYFAYFEKNIFGLNKNFKDLEKNITGLRGETGLGQAFLNNFNIFGKSLKDINISLKSMGKNSSTVFTALTGYFTKARLQAIGLKIAIKGVGLAIKSAEAIATLGLSLLASFAIEKITKVIDDLINHEKNLKEQVEELNSTSLGNINNNDQNINQLKELEDSYNTLRQKASLSKEEHQKFIDVQNQIAQIAPNVRQGYDEQGNAIIKLSGGVKGLIADLKEKNRLEAVKIANNFQNTKENYDNQVTGSQKKMNSANNVIQEKQKKLDEIAKQIADLQSSPSKSLTKKVVLDKHLQDQKELTEEIAKQNGIIDENKGKLAEAKSELDAIRTPLLMASEGYSKLTDDEKALATSMVSSIEPSELGRTSISKVVDLLNNASAQPMIEQMIRLQKNLDSGKISAEQFENSYNKVLDDISKISGINIDNTGLKKLFKDIIEDSKKSANSIEEVSKSVEDLQADLSSDFENVEKYGKFISEIKEKGNLSSSSKKEIITKEPDLIPYLTSAEKLMGELNKRVEEHKNSSKGAYASIKVQQESEAISKLKNDYLGLASMEDLNEGQKKDLADAVEGLQGKIQGLIVEKDNDGKMTIKNLEVAEDRIKSLALENTYIQLVQKYGKEEAKQKMLNEIEKTKTTIDETQNRATQYKKEYENALYWADMLSGIPFLGKVLQGRTDDAKAKFEKETKALEEQKKELEARKNAIENGDKIIASSEGEVNGIIETLTDNINENTEAQKRNTEAIKQAKQAIKEYENQLKSLENQLNRQKAATESLAEGSQERIDSIKQEIELMKQQQGVLKDGAESANQSSGSLSNIAGIGGTLGQQVVANAKNYLGKPYAWGGSSPSTGFDCSGLVQYVYQQVGKQISRTTFTQIKEGKAIDKNNLQQGDLVFFGTPDNPHHVGIYAGDGKYVHSPKTGDKIKISNLSDRGDYLTARRILSSTSNTAINNPNLTNNSVTVDKLNTMLKGALAGRGSEYVKYGQKYGIDPALAVAIATAETGHGTSPALTNYNNPAGVMDWDNNWKTIRKFSSLSEGIEFSIKNLRNGYLNQGLTSISAIGSKYAPLDAPNDPNRYNKNWIPTVTGFYNQLTGATITSTDDVTSAIQDLQSKALEFENQDFDVSLKIKESYKEIYNQRIKGYELEAKSYDTKIQQLETQNELEKSNSFKTIDNLKKVRDYNNDKIKVLQQEKIFIDEQIKNKNNLYDKVTIQEMQQKSEEITTSILEQSKAIKESISNWIQGVVDNIETKFKDSFDMIDNKLSRLENQTTVDLASKLLLDSQKIELTKQKIEEYTKAIREANEYMKQTGDTSQLDKIKELNSALDGTKTTLSELTKSALDTKNSISDLANSMLDKIKQVIQKTNEVAKEELNNNLKLFEDAVDKEIKKLDEAKNKMDNNETNYDNIQNIVKLQKELNALQGDDISTKSKKEEIQKQLEEANRKLRQDNNNQEIEARKSALEKAKDEYSKSVQTYSDNIDKNATDSSLNNQANTALLNGFIVDVNGNKIDLQTALIDFEDKFGQGLTVVGSKIKTELIDQLKEVQSLLKQFGTLDSTKINTSSQAIKTVYGTGIDLENAKAILGAVGYNYIDSGLIDTSTAKLKEGDISLGNAIGSSHLNGTLSIAGQDRYKTEQLLQIYSNILNGKMQPTGQTVYASGQNLESAKKYLSMFGYSFEDNGKSGVVNIGGNTLSNGSVVGMDTMLNNYAQQVLQEYISKNMSNNKIGSVYASGADLENAKKYLSTYGYQFIDTNDVSSVTLTPKDVVIGGLGVMKGANKAFGSGANWLWGSDRMATSKAIEQFAGDLKRYPVDTEGFSEGGDVAFTGYAMVHGTPSEPETMLNYEQGTNLHKFLTNIPNLVKGVTSSVRLPDFSEAFANSNIVKQLKNATQLQLQNSTGDSYRFEFNVDKLQGTEEEASSFAKRIMSKVKKRGY